MDPVTGKPDSRELPKAMARVALEEPDSEGLAPESDRDAIGAYNARKAQELYKAGTLFETKEGIRGLDQQIQDIRQKEPGDYEVTVTDLEGNPIKLPLTLGGSPREFPQLEEDGEPMETIVEPPNIIYCKLDAYTTLQALPLFVKRDLPFSSLGVADHSVFRYPKSDQASLEEVGTYFSNKRAEWEASEQGRNFLSPLESISELLTVRKIIAFATSSLSLRPYNRAAVQLALVFVIRDFFTKRQSDSSPILCYAQDPSFRDIDKQVHNENGIIVLEDPHGFLEIDDDTVVISHNADVPVRSITADLARPAMMIWNKIVDAKPPPAEWYRKGWMLLVWN